MISWRRILILLALVSACLVAAFFVFKAITDWSRAGTVARATEVPVVGSALRGLEATGPLEYAQHGSPHGCSTYVSGIAPRGALRRFIEERGLMSFSGRGSPAVDHRDYIARWGGDPDRFNAILPNGSRRFYGHVPSGIYIWGVTTEADGRFLLSVRFVRAWAANEQRAPGDGTTRRAEVKVVCHQLEDLVCPIWRVPQLLYEGRDDKLPTTAGIMELAGRLEEHSTSDREVYERVVDRAVDQARRFAPEWSKGKASLGAADLAAFRDRLLERQPQSIMVLRFPAEDTFHDTFDYVVVCVDGRLVHVEFGYRHQMKALVRELLSDH